MILKNVVVNGRRTSVRLEKEVWNALSECCIKDKIPLNKLCSVLDNAKDDKSLSSAMRVHALNFYRNLLEEYRFNVTSEE